MKGKYLLLGSNLGDRKEYLSVAKKYIEETAGNIMASSSIYETKAWGYEHQPDFLNQVIKINTKLNPDQLLSAIGDIEQELGRERYERWHERIIDIDILFYDDQIVKSEHLQIPHPEIPNRRFTLAPLQELCPDDIHPELHVSISALLEKCQDALNVKMLKE